jgi:hypothetical protein
MISSQKVIQHKKFDKFPFTHHQIEDLPYPVIRRVRVFITEVNEKAIKESPEHNPALVYLINISRFLSHEQGLTRKTIEEHFGFAPIEHYEAHMIEEHATGNILAVNWGIVLGHFVYATSAQWKHAISICGFWDFRPLHDSRLLEEHFLYKIGLNIDYINNFTDWEYYIQRDETLAGHLLKDFFGKFDNPYYLEKYLKTDTDDPDIPVLDYTTPLFKPTPPQEFPINLE